MNIKQALFALDDFCVTNSIEYCVTGSLALQMLGMPTGFYVPGDIDVLIYAPTEDQQMKLKEYEKLSGFEGYPQYRDSKCFTLVLGGVKVNFMVAKAAHPLAGESIIIGVYDEDAKRVRDIEFHKVDTALRAKIALGRKKDIAYCINLVHNIMLAVDARVNKNVLPSTIK